jgi:hypothetical protein
VQHENRRIVYTFTEDGNDMVPGDVYPQAQRSRFPFPVTYRDLPTIQVGRGHLRDAVRQLFDTDPGTSPAIGDFLRTSSVTAVRSGHGPPAPRLDADENAQPGVRRLGPRLRTRCPAS